jgi:predicted Zn-dependent peptidase
MDAQPGNVRVKKAIASEIQSIIDDGIDDQDLKDYVSNFKAQETLSSYSNSFIADQLGGAELYFGDYRKANDWVAEFEKITPQQLQEIAKKYFNPETLKIVNAKPNE